MKYLNMLIHGLLSAMKDFGRFKCNNEIPQLVTFKVGDLLRCKCSSKESEIISLYNEI